MKVIATDIANLTDARYFAAWGVEAMAYTLDPDNPDSLSATQLKEIVDWVEGPSTFVKMEGLTPPEGIDDVVEQMNINGAIIGPFIDEVALPKLETVFRICSMEEGWEDSNKCILVYPSDFAKASDQIKKHGNFSCTCLIKDNVCC